MTIQQAMCNSFWRSREGTDKFCSWEATQHSTEKAERYRNSTGPVACQRLHQALHIVVPISWIWGNVYTETAWYGHNHFWEDWEKDWLEGWTLWVLPVSIYPPFTHNFLRLTHLVHVCIFSKHHSVYIKCKPLCLEKLTCFCFTPHWLRLHTSGTEKNPHLPDFTIITLFHKDQHLRKKHCLILWISFLLFQELLCCSERPFALPAYSANHNTVHLHFTPFPLASVHLHLHAKYWSSRRQGISRHFLSRT